MVPGQESVPVLDTIFKINRDSQGLPVGEANTNPILDSCIYELEYPEGRIEENSVNTILGSLLEQTYQNGWDSTYLE